MATSKKQRKTTTISVKEWTQFGWRPIIDRKGRIKGLRKGGAPVGAK